MKKLLLLFLGIIHFYAFSQSDNCSTATTLTPGASCVYTAGTSAGATQSIPGCVGTADDDVWYQFIATSTSHQITVNPSSGYDPVVQLFSSGCSTLNNISCMDAGNTGDAETINATGLTIGQTYHIRVYHYWSGSGTSTFSICVSAPPPAPANDACANAIAVTVNSSCIQTAGTSYGATESYTNASCGGTPDDDVWYKFVANSSQQVITVTPSANMDVVVEIMSGSCGTFSLVDCIDTYGTGGTESATEVGLTPGTTYYVRVYDYWGGNGGYPFDICITGTSSTGDDPCNAIVIPAVTSDCSYFTMSNASFSSTSSALAPTPASCGGSSPYIGGYSASSHDVWFAITVPSTGNIYVTSEPNIPSGAITDGVMALYSGSCGSLTQISCNDDHNYPGSTYDYLPYISATGLTPGTTVYLRYWGYGSNTGNFGFCVSSPTNDACANALYICDLNGYSANTNGYTPDRPDNMRGDAEFGATYTWTPGSTSSGAQTFGMGGSWGVGQPYPVPPNTYSFDVEIDNNSWIKFTAAATTATFSVAVGNCFSTGGIQMQVFSGNNCTAFVPKSDFVQGSGSLSLTANGLTVGQNYYLMVDGWGGDLCSYTVTANSGVQIPTLTASPATICFGDSTHLAVTNASVGSTYLWLPGSQTTSSITVAPPTTMTYSCEVFGVCGNKQTLSKTVTVNALPTVLINGAATQTLNICANTTTTLTASGGSGNSYTWTPGTGLSASTGSLVTITPSATTNTTYTVTGANANGCKSTATITIKGLSLPTFSITNAHVNTCNGTKDTLTAVPNPAGTYTYSWSTGASTSNITPTITSNTVISVAVTNTNNCTSTLSTTVNVLALPSIASTSGTVCVGSSTALTGSGGTSYTWTPNTTLSSGGISTTSVTATPTTTTNYTITGIGANGCKNTSTATVTVNPLPTVTVNSATICAGTTATLTANGATTYSWSTTQSGQTITASPGSTTFYTVTGTNGNNCKNTATATITVNALPSLTATPSISPSNCGASTGSITGLGVSGSGTISYTWTNSSNVVVGNTQSITNQPAGTYNVLVSDANCSASFGPYSITNPGAPAAPTITTNTTTTCAGQTITANVSSGASSPTYTWTGPNSFTTTASSFTLNPTQVNQSGTYAVTITSAGCTSPAATVTLTINPLPIVTATASSNPYCAGQTVQLNGSSASTYTWSGPSSFSSNQQNPQIVNSTTLATGIYTLAVTDANGCVNTNTTSVTVNETPGLLGVSASNTTLCEGMTLVLNATATPTTATIQWTGPGGYASPPQSTTIPNLTISNSGIYSVVATLGSCSSNTNTLSITINPKPIATASISSSVACSGDNITLSGNGGVTYSWTASNGYTSNQPNNTLSNVDVNTTGTYSLIAWNSFGCIDTTTVSLTVNPTPTVTSISTNTATNIFCQGATVQLNSVVSPTTAVIQWTGPGGFSSPPMSTTITNATTAQSGSYSVTVTLGNCTSAASVITVTVNPTPIASAAASSSVVCSGNDVVLNGNPSGDTYQWLDPAGNTISTQQNYTLTNVQTNAGGTYTLMVTNSFSCSAQATTGFTVNQTPTEPLTSNVLTCTGGTLTVAASASGTINWYNDAALSNLVNTGNTFNPVIPSGTTQIYYLVTTANGCNSAGTTTVSVGNYNIQVVATADTYNGNAPLTVNFQGMVSGSSNPTYSWTLGDNATSTIQNPQHTYNNGGDYVVILTGTDPLSNCSDTAMLTIHMEDEMILIIPNIFTPNHDNINDTWFVTTQGVKSIEGWIMNRWGQMMFVWNNLGAAWDGKAPNGNIETDGEYFYVIKATSNKGEVKTYKGPLTLVR